MSEQIKEQVSPEETHDHAFGLSPFATGTGGTSMPPPPLNLGGDGAGEGPLQLQENTTDTSGSGGEDVAADRADTVHNTLQGIADVASTQAAADSLSSTFLAMTQAEFLAMKTVYDSTYALLYNYHGDNIFSNSTLIANIQSKFGESPEMLHQVSSAVGMQIPSPSPIENGVSEPLVGDDGSDVSSYEGALFTLRIAGYEAGQVVIGNNPLQFNVTRNIEVEGEAFEYQVMPHEFTIRRPDGEIDEGPYPYTPTMTGTYELTVGIERDHEYRLVSFETIVFRVETPTYRAENAMAADEAETYEDFVGSSTTELAVMTEDASALASGDNISISSNLAPSYVMDTQNTMIVTWDRDPSNIPHVEGNYSASQCHAGTFEWFIAQVNPVEGQDLPSELASLQQVSSDQASELGLSDAYPLFRLPQTTETASITYTGLGRYAIVVKSTPPAPEGQESVTSTAIFWQSLISEQAGSQAEEYERELNSVEDLINSLDESTRVNVSAQLVIQESGAVQDLDMYFGQVTGTNDWMLVDATTIVSKREYRGSSFADIMGSPNGENQIEGRNNGIFQRNNEYPGGVVHISIPGTASEGAAFRYNTDGSSNLTENGRWLGVAGTVLTIASIACPILAVPGAIVRAISIGAAVTSVASGAMNVADEMQNANPSGRVLTLEALNIASAFLGGAGEMLSGMRSVPVMRAGRAMIATSAIALETASTFMIAQDGLNALIQLEEQFRTQSTPMTEAEYRRRQGEIIGGLALTGGLYVISTAGNVDTVRSNTQPRFQGARSIDELNVSLLPAHEQEVYSFLTGVGLSPEISGSSLVFNNASGEIVARFDGDITYIYSGFNGDITGIPGETITVLGRFNDQIDGAGTGEILENGAFLTGENPSGLNVLDLEEWTPERNFGWLLQAVYRGDSVQLISDPAQIPNYFGSNGQLSIFAYEVGVLIDQGTLNASILPVGLEMSPGDLIHPAYQAMMDNGLVDRILAGEFTDLEVASLTLDD